MFIIQYKVLLNIYIYEGESNENLKYCILYKYCINKYNYVLIFKVFSRLSLVSVGFVNVSN